MFTQQSMRFKAASVILPSTAESELGHTWDQQCLKHNGKQTLTLQLGLNA